MDWKIYHNPACSKSRAALALLEERVRPVVREYLKNPLTEPELRELAGKLGLPPSGFLRKGEPILESLGIDLTNDDAVFRAIAEHPILLERPVVEHAEEAVLGRPTEKVAGFLERHLR